MPIPTLENDGYTDNTSNKISVDKNPYRTATVYGDTSPISRISNITEGSPWSVDYYTQLIDMDSQVSTPDVHVDITTLQYTKINNLILYITDALDPTYTNNEGVAYIHSGITPNINDVFKATIYGNRVAILIVTNVEYTTYNNNKRYKISFRPEYFLDVDKSIFDTIERQSIREYWYDKGDSHPLLLESEYNYKQEIIKAIPYLTELWLEIATTKKSFIHMPNTSDIIVDPYLEDFIWKSLSIEDNIKMVELTKLNILNDLPNKTSIYDVLITQNKRLLSIIDRKVYLDYTKRPIHPVMSRYGHIGVSKITVLSNDGDFHTKDEISQDTLPDTINYLFSDNFYDGVDGLTDIEQLVVDYLDKREIDYKDVYKVVEDMNNWNILDKFYYIPIVIYICNYYVRNKSTYI